MPTFVIRCRLSRAEVRRRIASIPQTIIASASVQARQTLVRAGNATLKVVSQAFSLKARGRADAAGMRWQKTVRRKVYPHGILVEKGILQSSLQPSKDPTQIGHTIFQVFRLGQGTVTVGTARPHAMLHHKGIPGKLPMRRLWPPLSRWPAKWKEAIMAQVARGIVGLLREVLR